MQLLFVSSAILNQKDCRASNKDYKQTQYGSGKFCDYESVSSESKTNFASGATASAIVV